MLIKGLLFLVWIEIFCDQDLILLNGIIVVGWIDDVMILNDGQWFKQFYFYVVVIEMVIVFVGVCVYVLIVLCWIGDGVFCVYELVLKFESDVGYLLKWWLNIDVSGVGSFVVEVLGFSFGDQIVVKINIEYYIVIGKIILEVV